MLIGGGCQSPTTPPAMLPANLSVDYKRAEPPQKGSMATTARLVELYAVADAPAGTPLALAAAAIVTGRANPFRGKTQLPIGSRWLAADDTNRWLKSRNQLTIWQQKPLATTQVILLPELMTSIAFKSGPASPGNTTRPMPVLQLQQFAGELRATLSTLPPAPAPTASEARPLAEQTAKDVKEVIVITKAIGPAEPFAVFVPDPRLPGGGLLLITRPCPTPEEAAIAAAMQIATAKLATPAITKSVPLSWQVAQQAVGERNRRPALLAVVTPLKLNRSVDLILAADEQALIAMTRQLATITATSASQPLVGWQVEAATWQALIPRMSQQDLPPALRAASRRHIGALANDSSTLQVLLKACTDAGMFKAHLIEENLAALSDRSAAIRVAAMEWLKSQKITVDGYDPMASKSERKKSIKEFFKARAAGR